MYTLDVEISWPRTLALWRLSSDEHRLNDNCDIIARKFIYNDELKKDRKKGNMFFAIVVLKFA